MELIHHQEIILLFHACFSYIYIKRAFCLYTILNFFSTLNFRKCYFKDNQSQNGSRQEHENVHSFGKRAFPFPMSPFQGLLTGSWISLPLTFYVILSNLCKAPASGEKLGILFLINGKCHECGTLLFLTFNICLCLYFLFMESDPI